MSFPIYGSLPRTELPSLEASSLGWAPGEWPIETTLHGQAALRWSPDRDFQGEIRYYVYRTVLNGTVRVYND